MLCKQLFERLDPDDSAEVKGGAAVDMVDEDFAAPLGSRRWKLGKLICDDLCSSMPENRLDLAMMNEPRVDKELRSHSQRAPFIGMPRHNDFRWLG
jgi:hypothetical protein